VTIQYVGRPGIVDLGWGHPPASLLPVDAWRAATDTALRRDGGQALAYGHGIGPLALREFIAERLAKTDDHSPVPAEICVTAGASAGLELVTGMLAPPGSTVLVDSPTYHLALRILADRQVTVRALPPAGELPDASMVYLVSTFANPTGRSLEPDRRRRLVEACAAKDIPIVEDDTYREMSYVDRAPASLWSLDPHRVVRIGSFAKTVAPGLRLGYLTASPRFVSRVADLGVVDSGGGLNHTAAVTMAQFGRSGAFEEHIQKIIQVYRHQRDTLLGSLARHVPGTVETPDGGWFLWLRLPDGVDADRLLPLAERHGVSFVPGTRFCVPPYTGASHIRLSFSMLDPTELEEGARRLGEALRG
jgi:2-aminoadipate transaminase